MGIKHEEIPVPKACWDGIHNFLKGKDWVKIGQKHEVAEEGTFTEYLDSIQMPNQHRHPDWGSYVPPVLEYVGLAEIDPKRPSKIRLAKPK